MRICLLILALFLHGNARAELAVLSSEELGAISGSAGVALSLDWRFNAGANGGQLSLCTDAATYRECRVAWAFNNRGTDDVDKKWLVFKGVRGVLKIPYMSVDASTVTYTSDAATSETISAVEISFGDANTNIQIKNLVIDNIAFETDNATRRGYEADASVEPTGAAIPANVNTGFMGLQMNGPGNVANVAIDGRIKIFSCLGSHPSC